MAAGALKKVIEIPAEPPTRPCCATAQEFQSRPPAVTDINLSLDDRFPLRLVLGNGRAVTYDVSIPRAQRRQVRCVSAGLLGACRNPSQPGKALAGGPQMVEVSRDGKRVYFTNSL